MEKLVEWLIQRHYKAFFSGECENPGKISVMIISIPLVACMREKMNS
jgi:hypothetical protein